MADPLVDGIVRKLYSNDDPFPETTTVGFSAQALRGYGKDVWKVWGAYCDEDIIELAVAARAALDALADRLERG